MNGLGVEIAPLEFHCDPLKDSKGKGCRSCIRRLVTNFCPACASQTGCSSKSKGLACYNRQSRMLKRLAKSHHKGIRFKVLVMVLCVPDGLPK